MILINTHLDGQNQALKYAQSFVEAHNLLRHVDTGLKMFKFSVESFESLDVVESKAEIVSTTHVHGAH